MAPSAIAGAGDVDERLGERQVGQTAGAEVDAVADDGDHAALARAQDQLSGEPGLADAGVAGHEHAGGRARERLLEQLLEPGELTGPADERRAGADRRHTGDRATRRGRDAHVGARGQAWRPIRTGRWKAKCSRCVRRLRRGCCCQSWASRARRSLELGLDLGVHEDGGCHRGLLVDVITTVVLRPGAGHRQAAQQRRPEEGPEPQGDQAHLRGTSEPLDT